MMLAFASSLESAMQTTWSFIYITSFNPHKSIPGKHYHPYLTTPYLLVNVQVNAISDFGIGLYPVHMMCSSPLEAGCILIYCLLRSCLPSPRCWISQLLLSLDLVPSQTHHSVYQNLKTPQISCDLRLPWYPATCLSPFWMTSRLPVPLCSVRGAEARTCIWKMTQQEGL